MAYDEGLSVRVEELLAELGLPDLVGKKMFSGIGYLISGNMACGVHRDRLIVRIGPENYQGALDQADVVPFDITGRPMKGWVMVLADGYESDQALRQWVEAGVAFAQSLPPK